MYWLAICQAQRWEPYNQSILPHDSDHTKNASRYSITPAEDAAEIDLPSNVQNLFWFDPEPTETSMIAIVYWHVCIR